MAIVTVLTHLTCRLPPFPRQRNEYCKTLCRKKYTPKEMEEFQDFAILDYRVNMRLDGLPVAEIEAYESEEEEGEIEETYNLGYPVGDRANDGDAEGDKNGDDENYILYNHLTFKILYNPIQAKGSSSLEGRRDRKNYIVGFQVIPRSIKHSFRPPFNQSAIPYVPLTSCSAKGIDTSAKVDPLYIDTKEGNEVIWTYDVMWEKSEIEWASRWDAYLEMKDEAIHWFAIVNSLVIVFFLTGIIALIMARVLRRDFARYSKDDQEEAIAEMREDTGWKYVYADVFRPPPHATLLSVYLGTGTQLFIMSILTLFFAALGFLSPANRGSLLQSILFFFVLMGVAAGYVSARYCKLVKEQNHFKATLLTSILFPGVCFIVFFVVNAIAWSKQSSTAVPFGTLVVLMLLWFGVSLPLIFFGSHYGFKGDAMELPCKTSALPREIPPQPWYLNKWLSILLGGMLPFGAVFVEMFFILSSIWQHRFYYMFGFLALVFLILVVTCAEISIVCCYLHLCAEDYRWWWRSFMTAAGTSLYMFAYAMMHWFSRAHPSSTYDILNLTVFFGYMLILCYAIFVLTGFIGFSACFLFIRKIYGSIKID